MKTDASREVAQIGRRVKVRREAAGLTLDQLSRMSGVSKAMLSQVERSKANPTVVVLLKIAAGLGCSLDDIVGAAGGAPHIHVVRADDDHAVYVRGHECTIRTLSPLSAERSVEFYELTLAPKGALRSEPHFHHTEEFLTVVSGKVKVISSEQAVTLRRGDSAHYRADVKHSIENVSASPARLYLVVKFDNAARKNTV
jgi:transcriptional regulator with XRE-family HTH domain